VHRALWPFKLFNLPFLKVPGFAVRFVPAQPNMLIRLRVPCSVVFHFGLQLGGEPWVVHVVRLHHYSTRRRCLAPQQCVDWIAIKARIPAEPQLTASRTDRWPE